MMDLFAASTLVMGVVIFLARVVDVSLGTIRTIATVQGRMVLAFLLGFFEVLMWLLVVAAVLEQIQGRPILGIFYALGYSTGNVAGIAIERRLALGYIILRLIARERGRELAAKLREMDYRVTLFEGEGARGPVIELYVVCERKDFRRIMGAARSLDPNIFYITEQPGEVRRLRKQIFFATGGWRAVRKRK